jgi:hypothetical protein
LQNGFSGRKDGPKKELGTASFLPVDISPNGRPLFVFPSPSGAIETDGRRGLEV